MFYKAGCSSGCPKRGNATICRLCHTDLCNTAIADEVRKNNLVCYTGPFIKGAMTLKRRRKIYCSDDEKNCYTLRWITDKLRAPKYFGGCGHQPCPPKKKGVACRLTNCTKSLCNAPPAKRRKSCPATGCNGADRFLGNSVWAAPRILAAVLLGRLAGAIFA
ncbi:hypothetical protein BOX15_Mlig012424g2 [Macrostomum lignano]|uniref:Uncharacterized protein n=1 Tax=Macrostomum lignano TaxID=282301 RepID=A0A267FLT7_9PLAT|nr:hypothetical protein BOX15_Mlig012424g2 [Macrostomum lignano]